MRRAAPLFALAVSALALSGLAGLSQPEPAGPPRLPDGVDARGAVAVIRPSHRPSEIGAGPSAYLRPAALAEDTGEGRAALLRRLAEMDGDPADLTPREARMMGFLSEVMGADPAAPGPAAR